MNILFFYFNDYSLENVIICAVCISKWRRFNLHLNIKKLLSKWRRLGDPLNEALHRLPLQMNVFENKITFWVVSRSGKLYFLKLVVDEKERSELVLEFF